MQESARFLKDSKSRSESADWKYNKKQRSWDEDEEEGNFILWWTGKRNIPYYTKIYFGLGRGLEDREGLEEGKVWR